MKKLIILLTLFISSSLFAAPHANVHYGKWEYNHNRTHNVNAIAYTNIGTSFISLVCDKHNVIRLFAGKSDENVPKSFRFTITDGHSYPKTYDVPNGIRLKYVDRKLFKHGHYVYVLLVDHDKAIKFSLRGSTKAINRLEHDCH